MVYGETELGILYYIILDWSIINECTIYLSVYDIRYISVIFCFVCLGIDLEYLHFILGYSKDFS